MRRSVLVVVFAAVAHAGCGSPPTETASCNAPAGPSGPFCLEVVASDAEQQSCGTIGGVYALGNCPAANRLGVYCDIAAQMQRVYYYAPTTEGSAATQCAVRMGTLRRP